MKINMKKQIIIGLGLFTFGFLQAQEAGHYLHFNVGGGFHNTSYQIQDGTQEGKTGYTVNAAYSYFFTPKWGIQSGLGLQSYQSFSNLNLLTKATEKDADNDTYELRTNYQGWREKQNSLFLDIPVLGQYRCAFGEKFGLMASAGFKISIPVQASYNTKGGTITTTGFYPQWGVELSDLPQHGFFTPSEGFKGHYSFKSAYMAVVDLGGLYKLSEKTDLYVGGYFNYGLNNVLKPDSKLIFQQDDTYNGILTSNQTDKLRPVAVGLKVGLYWRLSKKKRAIEKISDESVQDVAPIQPAETKPVEADTVVIAVVPEPQKPSDAERAAMALNKADSIAARINFNYQFNKDKPLNPKTDQVKVLSSILIQNPDITLVLIGHTCNLGTRKVNLNVGLRRALSAKKLFLESGVPAAQLKTKSKAYDEPLVPNTSVENRKKNRRVQVKVVR